MKTPETIAKEIGELEEALQCDSPDCFKFVNLSTRLRINAKQFNFCELPCLCRWVLLQAINWNGEEPWRS